MNVQAIRRAGGLTPNNFAQLLGVVPSTVYRWEGSKAPKIDPAQKQIMTIFARQIERKPERGKAIIDGLMVGGTMRGLWILLRAEFQGG